MSDEALVGSDLLNIEEALWILVPGDERRKALRASPYDFPFETALACRRPWNRPSMVEAVARIGAFSSRYELVYQELMDRGIRLVHTPEEHFRCSVLSNWYPLIHDLTPRSIWFDGLPDVERIERELGWPIFMKGERQTSYHRRALSIIHNREELQAALAVYATDPVLRWQRIACRQLAPLRMVVDDAPDRIPAAFEYRTFWWDGKLVGAGPYWWQIPPYSASESELEAAIKIAQEAAARVRVRFLVIDVAMQIDGSWIVIECNDGQESGYCSISPYALWNRVLDEVRQR